jgi:hypothetical protein
MAKLAGLRNELVSLSCCACLSELTGTPLKAFERLALGFGADKLGVLWEN